MTVQDMVKDFYNTVVEKLENQGRKKAVTKFLQCYTKKMKQLRGLQVEDFDRTLLRTLKQKARKLRVNA